MKFEITIQTFRRIVTTGILIFLSIHIMIALAVTFFQGDFRLGNSKVVRLYQRFVHLGPFYRDEAIKSSPHLVILTNGKAIDPIQEQANEYQAHPWKINRLAMRDFVHRTSNAFYRVRNKERSAAFRKLSRVTKARYPDIQTGDSVSWVYFHKYYVPNERLWVNDTLFHYSFKWKVKPNGK